MNDLPTHAASTGGGPPGPSRDLNPGDWIGPYQVLQELGRGGMGVVFRVRHGQTGHEAALKLILGSVAGELALARFGREAEALAKIQHRNVIRVFELGRAPQGPYLVLELLEGTPLEDLVRAGPLEPDRAVEILVQLCDAVSAVHGAGLLHRDLKPDNVIIRPDGTVVLLDFGVAQDESAEKLTQTGQLVGTPNFMSPEQAGGERRAVDVRSDVYGLGAILFTLLNGAPPFHEFLGLGQYSVILAVLKGDPTWPLGRELPRELVALTQSTLAMTPADRPPTADALKGLLERYLREGSRARARRPLRGVLAGALLVLLAAGGVAFALTRAAVDPTPATRTIPARPSDLEERIAKLGSFEDPGFQEALATLRADPAYADHLDSIRAARKEYLQVQAGAENALLRGSADGPLLQRLRAYLRAWPGRPESLALRDTLALLAVASEPLQVHVVERQSARMYGGACLDASGEEILAIGYSENPVVTWVKVEPDKDPWAGRYYPKKPELSSARPRARILPQGPRPEPLVHLTFATKTERALLPGVPYPPRKPGPPPLPPFPDASRPPSLTSYVAAPGGGAWIGVEQVSPPTGPGSLAARIELWSPPDLEAPSKVIKIPGIPIQNFPHLAQGAGQPRALDVRGPLLAVGMGDGLVLLFDHERGELLWKTAGKDRHKQRIMAVRILEDGRVVSASGRGLKEWDSGYPSGEEEDMRVVLWSPAGKPLQTYLRAFGRDDGRMGMPKFLELSGTQIVAGADTNRVVCVIDLDAPDDLPGDAPGSVHRLLKGERIESNPSQRGEIGSHAKNWAPSGPEPQGALWLSPERVLVWGDFGGWTELRVFEVPLDRKRSPRQLLGWARPDRVQAVWLSPDGSHLFLSARSKSRFVRNRIERRRLVP